MKLIIQDSSPPSFSVSPWELPQWNIWDCVFCPPPPSKMIGLRRRVRLHSIDLRDFHAITRTEEKATRGRKMMHPERHVRGNTKNVDISLYIWCPNSKGFKALRMRKAIRTARCNKCQSFTNFVGQWMKNVLLFFLHLSLISLFRALSFMLDQWAMQFVPHL